MNPNNRNLNFIAFFLGLAAVTWIALGYVGGSTLALGVSCVIAAVYVVGAFEMRRFHGDTAALAGALDRIPDDITDVGEWLQQVPATLRNAVRLRIEGERIALPGPGVTPYLVGLLVLLGMLGTFLGMVVTLNGAVLALESTTDLHTIRSALAAPVKGLGVAFGTSVAGVATSAMLGLISTLARRDRQQIAQLLDSKIAGALRGFSFAHQRQETFKALQTQAQALPELVGKLDAMMSQMTEQNRQLGEQLLAGQQRFRVMVDINPCRKARGIELAQHIQKAEHHHGHERHQGAEKGDRRTRQVSGEAWSLRRCDEEIAGSLSRPPLTAVLFGAHRRSLSCREAHMRLDLLMM